MPSASQAASEGRFRGKPITSALAPRSRVSSASTFPFNSAISTLSAAIASSCSSRHSLPRQIVPAHIALLGMIDQLALVIEDVDADRHLRCSTAGEGGEQSQLAAATVTESAPP